MNLRAQTTIEMLLILAISILALGIIYSLYGQQLDTSFRVKEYSSAKSTLDKVVNTANSLYASGAGSKAKILIDLPYSLDMSGSYIDGKMLVFRLSNGNDIFALSDVNIIGDWKKINGSYSTGGYYMNLLFDGNVVLLSYDDFQLSTQSIYASAKQGSVVLKNFNIRNNSSNTAYFWVSTSFSHSAASISIDPNDVYFSLLAGETRTVDFNIALADYSSGNYAGLITVIGQVNDGVSDSNVTKQVVVSVESFLRVESMQIFPKLVSISMNPNTSTLRGFNICNLSNSDFSSITWSRDSNSNGNMLTWFNWEPKDYSNSIITAVNSGSCVDFNLTFTVPLGADIKTYDANIIATYGDGNTTTSYFYISVTN
ncbi:MAG: hypothetical protein WCW13_03035 [archaeon]|jgi:hypothetical protein